MRTPALIFLLLPMITAHAGTVEGFCERDGTRITFSDGIAFVDARDSDGVVTTTLYLTAKALDRSALAQCTACLEAPGENTFVSPRGDMIEAQRTATADGWAEIQHVGGELDMTTLVNLMYMAKDGTLTGLDGGNSRFDIEVNDSSHIVGTLSTEAHEPGMDETDMNCSVTFDQAVGWPKP